MVIPYHGHYEYVCISKTYQEHLKYETLSKGCCLPLITALHTDDAGER